MHPNSIANGRFFLPFINADSSYMAGPTHEFKGPRRFRCRMPQFQNKPPQTTLMYSMKNPGAVIESKDIVKTLNYIDNTYHHTFTFDLSDIADTCGRLRNVYIYNDRVTVMIWKEDKQLINRPEINESSFYVGKNAFK